MSKSQCWEQANQEAQAESKRGEHTPTPFKRGREDYAYFEHGGMTLKVKSVGIDGANGDVDLCRVVVGDPFGEGEAIVELILTACNAYASNQSALAAKDEAIRELREALEEVFEAMQYSAEFGGFCDLSDGRKIQPFGVVHAALAKHGGAK